MKVFTEETSSKMPDSERSARLDDSPAEKVKRTVLQKCDFSALE